MNIEDIRFLLSALLQALPTVLSLGLIALFAFPKTRKGIKNRKMYAIFMFVLIMLSVFILVTTCRDAITLMNLEYLLQNNPSQIESNINYSIVSLALMPLFLIFYLITVFMIELEAKK